MVNALRSPSDLIQAMGLHNKSHFFEYENFVLEAITHHAHLVYTRHVIISCDCFH